jgi:uncharacterized protein YggT (Ycf19 family)
MRSWAARLDGAPSQTGPKRGDPPRAVSLWVAGWAAGRARSVVMNAILAGALIVGSTRTDIANFLSTLIYVYTLLIIVFIVIQLLFAVGLRPPYSRTMDALLGFLRDVCEPFLRIFRRVIPSLGGIDFSPILAILTLQLFNSIVVGGIIHG